WRSRLDPDEVLTTLTRQAVTVGMTFGNAPVPGATPPPGPVARMLALLANARRMREAGVNMIAGTDAGGAAFAATQSRQNSLPSMSCITRHDSLSPSAGSSRTAYRAERDQSCAFGLKCGHAFFTHEPGADAHVKMQPILDDLVSGSVQSK